MIMPWEYPWDHAAGLLLHAEAGGTVIGMDGEPFAIAGGNALPAIAAPDLPTALALRDALSDLGRPVQFPETGAVADPARANCVGDQAT
jgi:hypothetical protein